MIPNEAIEKLVELWKQDEQRRQKTYPYAVIGYNGVILPELPKCWDADAPKDGDT
jgi:hypothetical protein